MCTNVCTGEYERMPRVTGAYNNPNGKQPPRQPHGLVAVKMCDQIHEADTSILKNHPYLQEALENLEGDMRRIRKHERDTGIRAGLRRSSLYVLQRALTHYMFLCAKDGIQADPHIVQTWETLDTEINWLRNIAAL